MPVENQITRLSVVKNAIQFSPCICVWRTLLYFSLRVAKKTRDFSPQDKGMMSDVWLLREIRGQLHFNFHRRIAFIFHIVHKFYSKLSHLHLSSFSLWIKLLFTSYDSPRFVISNLFSPPFIDAGFNSIAYILPLPSFFATVFLSLYLSPAAQSSHSLFLFISTPITLTTTPYFVHSRGPEVFQSVSLEAFQKKG